jgi:hypothetical protein
VTPISQHARSLRERYLPDHRRPVQAYASACSAVPGGSLEFRVSVPGGESCSVTVRRFGTAVPTPAVRFSGEAQDAPMYVDALTWCDWEPSLVLDIPDSWPPGLYVARFSVGTRALSVSALRGRSCSVPFVVRAEEVSVVVGPRFGAGNDDASGSDPGTGTSALVVLPFATYAARNRWPVEGATGRNLEVGYTSSGRTSFTHRASAVSLDRPFSGNGLPEQFEEDALFVERLVATGFDGNFATSVDLHDGTVDPRNYDSVLFSPRDVYWTHAMRDAVTKASENGTEIRWPAGGAVPPATVRFEPSPDGRPDRVLARAASLPDHLLTNVPDQG